MDNRKLVKGDKVRLYYNNSLKDKRRMYSKLHIGTIGEVTRLETRYLVVDFGVEGCEFGVYYQVHINESDKDYIRVHKYVPVQSMLEEIYD